MFGTKKMLAQALSDLKTIKDSLSPTVISKAERCKALDANLSNVKMSVRSISKQETEYGTQIKVSYSIPEQMILVDDDGKVSCSDTFGSINFLDLISAEDEAKLSDEIAKAVSQKEAENKK